MCNCPAMAGLPAAETCVQSCLLRCRVLNTLNTHEHIRAHTRTHVMATPAWGGTDASLDQIIRTITKGSFPPATVHLYATAFVASNVVQTSLHMSQGLWAFSHANSLLEGGDQGVG